MENPPAEPEARAALAPALPAAGFWLRAGAYVLDGLLLGAAVGLVALFLPDGLAATLRLAAAAAYFTLLPALNEGRTLGKMAAGLAIVREDGAPLGAGRCFARWLGYLFSGLLAGTGFLLAAFTKSGRALHDYVAGTRVVRTRELGAGRKAAVIAAGVAVPLGIVVLSAAIAVPRLLELAALSAEGATKGRLASLRSATAVYFGDHAANPADSPYPAALEALVPKYAASIEPVGIKEHPNAAGVELYDAQACGGADGKEADPGKLRDTGKWGYIADPKAPCWGRVFVDCTHTDSKGSAWASY